MGAAEAPTSTGLLHRLGARAAGTAWAVRSDLRLPFGTAPAGDAMPMAEAPGPGTPATAVPHPAETQAVRAATMAPSAQVAPTAPARAAKPPTRPLPPAVQPAAPATHGTADAAPHQRDAAAQQPRPLPAPQAGPEHMAPQPRGSDATAPPLGHRQAPAASREAPAPLLPVRDAAHAATGISRPFQRTPGPTAGRAAAAMDTEVHIHIGRIDVAAAQTAAPTAPKPRARPQPMSLDDYLARKGGAR